MDATLLQDLVAKSQEMVKAAQVVESENTNLRKENQTLTSKVASLEEQVRLVKVASSTPPGFSGGVVKRALDRLQELNVITPALNVKLAAKLEEQPDYALGMLVKIAEGNNLPEVEGGPAGIKSAKAKQAADVDGWDAWLSGQPVPIRE